MARAPRSRFRGRWATGASSTSAANSGGGLVAGVRAAVRVEEQPQPGQPGRQGQSAGVVPGVPARSSATDRYGGETGGTSGPQRATRRCRYSSVVIWWQRMRSWTMRSCAARGRWWRWGRVELPVRNPWPGPTTSVSDAWSRPTHPHRQGRWSVQLRVPRSGFAPGYAALAGAASPLSDASTAHGEEAASTLTLPPKRRGREQAACWQLLRFAAF